MNESLMNLLNPRRILLPGLLATAMLAGACSSDDSSSPSVTDPTEDTSGNNIETDGDNNGGALLRARLRAVDSCDALLDEFREIGSEHVGPYGFGDGFYGIEERFFEIDEDIALEESGSLTTSTQADSDAIESASDDGGDFSGTNNQEVGVDEPDLVKTDGERLVTLTDATFRIVDIDSAEISHTINLPEGVWATNFFLTGDRILALAQGWTEFALSDSSMPYPYGASTTQILDISIETGQIERTLEVEGGSLSARDVDGSARIVLSASIGQQFDFLYPSGEGANEAAENANRQLIAESTIEQWIPTYRLLDNDGEVIESGPIAPCDRFFIPGEFAGFGTISVLTLDLDEGLEIKDRLAVMTNGQTVYASTDRLTVATARAPEFDNEGMPIADEDYSTALHSFDITSAERTEYTGSGSVVGSLLNQYSLSEHNGYLRVATTKGNRWWNETGELSESYVTVLEESDGDLVTVGQVGGLGEGEQIFAVRFMGDIGYVVTFEQIDPLYTIDLSEPTAPTVLGELKIPGFSTYLHPIDDGLLLGVGQDGTDEGFTTGAQVSAFDVSDLTNPDRVDALGFGENSYSPVDWDAKAFTWWADTRTAFIPVSSYFWDDETGTDENNAAVVAVQIDEAGTLTELGRISHPRTEECETWFEEGPIPVEPNEGATETTIPNETTTTTETGDAEAGLVESGPEPRPIEETYCWSYQPDISRTVIIDGSIYTVSYDGVQISTLDGLAAEKWLPFN